MSAFEARQAAAGRYWTSRNSDIDWIRKSRTDERRPANDEETLKAVADVTRGEYFYAGTAADLTKVYQSLNSKLILERKSLEVTSVFAAVAALLIIIALTLSLVWFNRVT